MKLLTSGGLSKTLSSSTQTSVSGTQAKPPLSATCSTKPECSTKTCLAGVLQLHLLNQKVLIQRRSLGTKKTELRDEVKAARRGQMAQCTMKTATNEREITQETSG